MSMMADSILKTRYANDTNKALIKKTVTAMNSRTGGEMNVFTHTRNTPDVTKFLLKRLKKYQKLLSRFTVGINIFNF